MYIVTSKPKRISVNSGLLQLMIVSCMWFFINYDLMMHLPEPGNTRKSCKEA